MIGRALARIVKHRVETPAERDRHIYELEEELELVHTVDAPTDSIEYRSDAYERMLSSKNLLFSGIARGEWDIVDEPQVEVEPEQLPEFGGAAPAVFDAPALVQELAAIDREARGDRFLERHGVRP